MIPQLNHTEDTLLVSIALVIAGFIVARAFNRLTLFIKELRDAQLEANEMTKQTLDRWGKYPTDYMY